MTLSFVHAQPIYPLLLIACLSTSPLLAEIANHSFEEPELGDGGSIQGDSFFGWNSIPGGGNTGIYNPLFTDFVSGMFDGENVAYANPGAFHGGGIQQSTSILLAPGTYELRAIVGRRMGHTVIGYSNELWVGTDALTPSFVDHPLPDEGKLVEAITRYEINDDHNLIGQPIRIMLFTSLGGNQTNWDSVRIMKIPEPSMAIVLAGLFAMLILSRRRYSRRGTGIK